MVAEFLNYMKYERNRSDLTVKSYGEDLKLFEAYFKGLDSHIAWETVDSDVIRDWMGDMIDKGNNATTINRRLSALRSLYRFALAHRLICVNPTRSIIGLKRDKLLPQFLKEKEINQLLDVQTWDNTYKDVRARTIILMFYVTGVRLAELVGMNDDDIDFVNNQLKVTGKRDKQRIIPFGDELQIALKEFMGIRDNQVVRVDTNALFLSDRGTRVKRYWVENEVRNNLSKVCSLKKRSPHVLRHTFATAMMNNGAGIESVKKLLGHESLSTTEIYTHTTFEQLKKEYTNAHPRA